MQANWRVAVKGKLSVNKLAGVFAQQCKRMATSSTDVAELVPDSTVHKTTKESVSVQQGHLRRAAEPDQCALKVKQYSDK